MVTVNQIEKLLDTKLAMFQNNIIEGLTNSIMTKEYNATPSPTSPVISAAAALPLPVRSTALIPLPEKSSTPPPDLPGKSFDKECIDLQTKKVHNLH